MDLPGADLGAFIKQRRQELGISQRALAKRVGVSASYMSQIEKGTRQWPKKYIGAIASELQVSEADLAIVAGVISDEDPEGYIDQALSHLDKRVAQMSTREFQLFSMISHQLRLDMGKLAGESESAAQRWRDLAEDSIRAVEEATGVSIDSLRAPTGGYVIPTEQDGIDALHFVAVNVGTEERPNIVVVVDELHRDSDSSNLN